MDIKKQNEDLKSLHKLEKTQKQGFHKIWLGGYVFIALALLILYFLLRIRLFEIFGTYLLMIQKVALGGFVAMLILVASKVVEMIVLKKSKNKADTYNLLRLIRLLAVLLIIFVGVSFLFKEWYAAAVSLGLISLILGFALQTPISSFIAWLYIIIREPYQVGDRIQIDTLKGDVVEINYLDTTLWEFSGDYLTNDVPSGRLIRFPNSLVLQVAVYNYSWEKFPYIWNEIPLHIAYESDFKFVEETIIRVAKEELGTEMADNVERFKGLLAQTAVNELEIKEYPTVNFRISANTWVEVVVTYLVEPKHATSIRTNIIKKIIAELLKEPDKVMFPKSNNR